MVTNLSIPDDCCIFVSECFKTDKTQFDLAEQAKDIKINGPPMLSASLGRKAAGDRNSMRFTRIFACIRAFAQPNSDKTHPLSGTWTPYLLDLSGNFTCRHYGTAAGKIANKCICSVCSAEVSR